LDKKIGRPHHLRPAKPAAIEQLRVKPPVPDLFSPYTLKDITLRNRIAMSPMTMYRSLADGQMNDFHVMLLGSRAAGGFGLVFPEQLAILPDGRTGTSCAGIYDDSQIEGLSRVTAIALNRFAVIL
jgi:2,4-dienoyl-CoA reductase-like NADH-dependent reductase (Old Yellow Enzyme family)